MRAAAVWYCYYCRRWMMMMVLLLLLLSLENSPTAERTTTTRVVVTFRSASYNTLEAAELVPDDITVVKQYGRRLVLHLGADNNGTLLADAIAGIWGGGSLVERVEPDWLVGVEDRNNNTSNNNSNHDHEPLEEEEMASSEVPPPPWHLDPAEPYGLHLDPVLTRGNASSVVALLDSGLAAVASGQWSPVSGFCFISSPDYTNTNLGRNPDFTDPGDQGSACPTPSWHGTKVASVVRAVAPNARLSILRVLGQCGKGFASDVTDAIVWAAGGWISGVKTNPFPAKVVSMSLAGKGPCPTYMQSAVNQAIGLGATVIAAAGNAGANATLYFPGNCRGVLSIGASTRQGTLASYSNWGETLAFSAPGGDGANPVQVVSVSADLPVLTPATAVGTSFAAPHVAGVVALLQAINVSLDQGGEYVPCVPGGGCGVKVILNGISKEQKQVIMPHQNISKYANDSQLFMTVVCSWCAVGTYNSQCFGTSPGLCENCPPTHFCRGAYGQPTAWTTITCYDGFYLSTPPSSTSDGVCTACSPGDFCEGGTAAKINCPAGWFCSSDAKVKTVCPAGSYCLERSTSPTQCNEGTSSGISGASSNVCLLCSPGFYSDAKGLTACKECQEGSFSAGGGISQCTQCEPNKNQYQNLRGTTACNVCTGNNCAAGQNYQQCTATQDRQCTVCTLYPNCRYQNTIGCVRDGGSNIPSCSCAPGFQMNNSAASKCVQCPPGTWKSLQNYDVCNPWMNASQCEQSKIFVPGTRTQNSQCIDFPTPAPDNAVVPLGEANWMCNAGYERFSP